MNQDFTVKKKQYLSEKKFVQRGSPEKQIPAQTVSDKKKFVQAENCWFTLCSQKETMFCDT